MAPEIYNSNVNRVIGIGFLCLSFGIFMCWDLFVSMTHEANVENKMYTALYVSANVPQPAINTSQTVNISKAALNKHWIQYKLDEKHKLLYCAIPKNAVTMFKHLFYALINDEKSINRTNGFHNPMNKYTSSGVFVVNKMLNTHWKSLLILRDPLERLLSGFLNKCKHIQFTQWCNNTSTTRNDFQLFANRVIDDIYNNKIMKINKHFRPQYTFCKLTELFQYFDYVIYYHKSTIGNDTLRFLTNIGIDHFYYIWGQYHNETMFASFTTHATSNNYTDSINDKIEFYSKYYDLKLALKVYNAHYKDYQIFNMQAPEWINYLPKI